MWFKNNNFKNNIPLKCPKCNSDKVHIKTYAGLAPFNIWNDYKCENCGFSWGTSSPVEKWRVKKIKLENKTRELENKIKEVI